MSDLIRWEPARDMMTLREAMDQLFNDAFTRPLGGAALTQAPAIDLYQDSDKVVVKASLPGFKPEDVQISVTGDVLTLRGEYKHENDQKEKTYHLREQHYSSFERSVRLPSEIQADKANADFENGILTISLPKAESVKPRMVTINAKK